MSTAHKDPYENMYCVVRGEKTFMLVPPTAAPFVEERPFAQATHRYDTGSGEWVVDLDLEPDAGPVNWVDAPALRPPSDGKPLGEWTSRWRSNHKGGQPILHCSVKQGQILFIPSGWYHQVGLTNYY